MRKYAYWLTLVLIFMMPWEGAVRFPGAGTLIKFTGFGVAGFWLLTVFFTGQLRKPDLYMLLVTIFMCWNAFSIFWTTNTSRTLTQLITWAQLLIMIYIIWDLLTTRTAVFAGLQAYVLGTYVAIGSAISNYFAGDSFYSNYERFSAGDTNPDGFGFLLALGIPVAWYLTSVKTTSKWGPLLRWVNFAFIPAVLFGLALSGTRTALIASVVGMSFGLLSLTRIRPLVRFAFVLPALAIAIIVLLPRVQNMKSFERFGTISNEIATGTLNERLILWRDGYEAFLEHSIVGVGSNNYRSINSLGKVAHNSYISVLVELGVVGFTIFALILGNAFIKAWQLPRWHSIFFLTVLVVWAIGASTLTWEARKTTWLFLTLISVSAALPHRQTAPEPLFEPDDGRARRARQLGPGTIYAIDSE